MKDDEKEKKDETPFDEEMDAFYGDELEIAPEKEPTLPPSQQEEYAKKSEKLKGTKSGSLLISIDGKRWPYVPRGFGPAPGAQLGANIGVTAVANTANPVPDNYVYHISSIHYFFSRAGSLLPGAVSIDWSAFGFMVLIDRVAIYYNTVNLYTLATPNTIRSQLWENHVPVSIWVPENSAISVIRQFNSIGGDANSAHVSGMRIFGELIEDVAKVGRGRNLQATAADWITGYLNYWGGAAWT